MATVQLHLTPADHGRRLTLEEFRETSRRRDYVTKRREYLTYPSVREYGIVDPKRRQVTVLVRDGEDWSERVAGDSELIPSQVLPALACRVSDPWVGVVARNEDE
jgi:Uma2 family endonuclease